MFRFRLGRIPVEVHFSHLVINLLIAWSLTELASRDVGWPGPQLRDTTAPGHQLFEGAVVLLWMVLISASVLVHELGHALAGLAFELEPSVHLLGMGGITRANTTREFPWTRELAFRLAGPAFGLGLAVSAAVPLVALKLLERQAPVAEYVFEALAIFNGLWTALNLLPVPPLDGGLASLAVFRRLLGRQGYLAGQGTALAVSLLLVTVGLVVHMPLVALLFGMYALRALIEVIAFAKGEQPPGSEAHPLALEIEGAEAKLREGRVDEARRVAEAVLAKAPPAVVRSRAHLLLGWLATKDGQGRAALDHFAQVQGVEVPKVALAAAFSLVGDDERALGLWEAAASASSDPVVRHEHAGTLLRLGRELEVKRLPAVRLSVAWAAAQRVHFVRGEYEKAARACEAAFREEPSARSAYDAACGWAKAGDATAAFRMLTLAAQNGFAAADEARGDPDLASLRERPEFLSWLAGLPKPAAP